MVTEFDESVSMLSNDNNKSREAVMCMKLGSDEFETVKSLMSMTLFAIISDCLDVDIGEINYSDLMCRDLGMSCSKEQEVKELIADIYDGFETDFSTVTTVQSLLDQVLAGQFLPADRVLH